ncbi:MAG: hypothetical protein K2X93_14270 [Candidatus Obscuribacterales bacterium]|nr:hypothetical protein [Candidatus Obscuribacterales bacterium]
MRTGFLPKSESILPKESSRAEDLLLSSLYERTGQTDLAKKAIQDLESIKDKLPPAHFKSTEKLNISK